jgi:hypothetical protein
MQDNSVLPIATRRNGSDGGFPLPTSRRAFLKAAPVRIGFVEDAVEAQTLRIDAIVARLSDAEAVGVRLDNLIEIVTELAERVSRIDRRSARARRRIAVLSDQVESTV